MSYNVTCLLRVTYHRLTHLITSGATLLSKQTRKITSCGFQLAQLVKFLVVEQETWVQIPPTPKINWCLGLMVRATIMNGRHRFKSIITIKKERLPVHNMGVLPSGITALQGSLYKESSKIKFYNEIRH